MSRHISGMSMVLSIIPLYSLVHYDQNEVKHDWYLHCCHVMLTTSSMAPFCQLGKDN